MGAGAPGRGGFGSFGRREEQPEQSPVLVIPPLQLTSVQVPLVLVVDPSALAEAAKEIQAMVRTAVTAGFDEAMNQIGHDSAEAMAADEFGINRRPSS